MMRIRTELGQQVANLNSAFSENAKRRFQKQTFRIDVQQTVKYAMRLQKQNLESQSALQKLILGNAKVLEVHYEDLLYRQTETIPQILSFLGVQHKVKLSAKIGKATSDQLSKSIENYDELAEAVSGTELAVFLEDESPLEVTENC